MKTLLSFVLLAAACISSTAVAAPAKSPNENNAAAKTIGVGKRAARLIPTELSADISKLSARDRVVLAKLVEASKVIDAIFLRQVWTGNVAMLLDLTRDQTPLGRARLHYFRVNRGPWSRLDEDKPFIAGAPPKPENAGFYPSDSTKPELEAWIASLPEEERKLATGFFTVIHHDADGRGFRVVPYNMEYQSDLLRAASLLREAADAATEPTLKRFLTARAEAFL